MKAFSAKGRSAYGGKVQGSKFKIQGLMKCLVSLLKRKLLS
jgi:hypothetical protein